MQMLFSEDDAPQICTNAAMVAEAEREVSMRQQVYPRRVANGRMSQEEADRRIFLMENIAKTLKGME